MSEFVEFVSGQPVVLACPACGPVPAGAIAVECTSHAQAEPVLTEGLAAELHQAGRDAHAAGKLRAPACSSLVMSLVKDAALPVGGGRYFRDVCEAYSGGYEAAINEELAALGF